MNKTNLSVPLRKGDEGGSVIFKNRRFFTTFSPRYALGAAGAKPKDIPYKYFSPIIPVQAGIQ